MNFAIFKLTFKKALNSPNEYDAALCMNQLMIEVNRPNEDLIKNILKGCFNTIQRPGENIKKIRALMVLSCRLTEDYRSIHRHKEQVLHGELLQVRNVRLSSRARLLRKE